MGQRSDDLEHVEHHTIEVRRDEPDESIRHAVDKMLGADSASDSAEELVPEQHATGSTDIELPVAHAASAHSVKISPIVVKPMPQEDVSSTSVVAAPSLSMESSAPQPEPRRDVITPVDSAAAELAASGAHDDTKRETDAASTDPDQIRADIERTRDDMSRTIDAIQDKLDPQRIKEHVKESVHDATIGRVERLTHDAREKIGPTAKAKGAAAAEFVKKYPLPLAVAALSLAWLMFKRGHDDDFTIEL